jgi:hypothetical protein
MLPCRDKPRLHMHYYLTYIVSRCYESSSLLESWGLHLLWHILGWVQLRTEQDSSNCYKNKGEMAGMAHAVVHVLCQQLACVLCVGLRQISIRAGCLGIVHYIESKSALTKPYEYD